jgi:hypothetical protein
MALEVVKNSDILLEWVSISNGGKDINPQMSGARRPKMVLT